MAAISSNFNDNYSMTVDAGELDDEQFEEFIQQLDRPWFLVVLLVVVMQRLFPRWRQSTTDDTVSRTLEHGFSQHNCERLEPTY